MKNDLRRFVIKLSQDFKSSNNSILSPAVDISRAQMFASHVSQTVEHVVHGQL